MEKHDNKVISTSQKTLTQETIDDLLVKFVIKTMSPITIVENEHFRKLIFSEFFGSFVWYLFFKN